MDFSFLNDSYYIVTLLQGLLMTLVLAFIAVVFGSVLGLFPAFLSISKNKIYKFIGTTYVEIIRGTPLLIQVLLIYSFIKIPYNVVAGIDISSFIPGMIALLINASAYIAEIIRGGIIAVNIGQKEASLSLGLTDSQTMRYIIMPQAIKNILPSLGNEFAALIKETSIFMYLGIAELMYSAQIVKTSTYLQKEVYIVTALLYFVLTFSTSKLMKYFERRLHKYDKK